MSEEGEYSKEEEYYGDWLSDHKNALKEMFIEENEDLFSEFCRNKFGCWEDGE